MFVLHNSYIASYVCTYIYIPMSFIKHRTLIVRAVMNSLLCIVLTSVLLALIRLLGVSSRDAPILPA